MDPQEFYGTADNLSLHLAEHTEHKDLTDDEKWLVTLSGIFSSLAGDNINTIETDHGNGEVREALRRSWFISDRPTFEQAVVRLATSDKRSIYLKRLNVVKKFDEVNSGIISKFMLRVSFRFAIEWYQTKTKDDLKKISKDLDFDRIKNIDSKTYGLYYFLLNSIRWTKELEKIGDYRLINNLIGWDAVSLVHIVRCATQVQYITREEFVKYANPIKKQVQEAYNSWDELVLAYLIGNLIEEYSDEKLGVMIRVARLFLTDAKSPVNTVAFK